MESALAFPGCQQVLPRPSFRIPQAAEPSGVDFTIEALLKPLSGLSFFHLLKNKKGRSSV